MPKVRQQAVFLVFSGWGIRKTARYFGVQPSTVTRWVQKSQPYGGGPIPTLSSRPHHHPRELPFSTVNAILEYRQKHRRCAEVLHYLLTQDGYAVSLSSVKRVLRRYGCTRYSKWKKWHQYPERPKAEKPGILVQIDTIWDGISADRLYLYTLLDVCSRWGYAWPVQRIAAGASVRFIQSARQSAPFSFQTLQSDHGSEFSKWFTKRMQTTGLSHRHSRVRTPSDNGHLERFNRTIQEECLSQVPRSLRSWRREIPRYLNYYNTERPHMALGMKTPLEVLRSY